MGLLAQRAAVPEDGDRELVDRMLAGDEAAFSGFFEGHFPGLYRFALSRLRDPELAAEIVQTAICKAIANLSGFRGDSSLAGWLFTICRYEISGHFRRRRRSPMAVELTTEGGDVRHEVEAAGGEDDGPQEALERRELRDSVHAVLDQLPPRYGQALEWKYLEGLPVKEIAARLEVGPKAAESLLTRARRAFQEAFAKLGEPRRWPPPVELGLTTQGGT